MPPTNTNMRAEPPIYICEILFSRPKISERQADGDHNQPLIPFCLENLKPLSQLNFLMAPGVNMVQWNLSDRRN